jgi:hypothetical protein
MMVMMGHAPNMSIDKKPQYAVLTPNIQGRFNSGVDQDVENKSSFLCDA